MALHKSITELARSKVEQRKAGIAKEEGEAAAHLGKIDELEERLWRKTREAEEKDSKRAESEGSCRKLVEQVESLSSELHAVKLKNSRRVKVGQPCSGKACFLQ